MYCYQSFESCSATHGSDPCTTYGIRCWQKTEKGPILVATVEDISSNQEFVVQLADRCSRLCLAPEHLMDAILDAVP